MAAMKSTAKKARLADLPGASGAVKGGGIKVPQGPSSAKRPLIPCL